MRSHVEAFVAAQWPLSRNGVRVTVRPLRGGLECAIARVTIAGRAHPTVPKRLIIKALEGAHRREKEIYEHLWTHLVSPPIARMLGTHSAGGTQYLFLEDVLRAPGWPWCNPVAAIAVCRTLARLHEARGLQGAVFDWNYEAELERSAEATLAAACTARSAEGERYWRRLGDLRRVAAALPQLRARAFEFGTAVIHGDVHPGNVIVRAGENGDIALIDWGRARVGSPLEDIASWLCSVGCWEFEARRRHDTLLRAYLEARDGCPRVTPALRAAYWFASARNGLSGAIRHHLTVLRNRASTARMRRDSTIALRAWERVVRRAATLLSTTPAR